MTSVSMVKLLAQEFMQDTLYKQLVSLSLQDELFDAYIDGLDVNKEYSTSDFEVWYCSDPESESYLAHPSTMRSWQKQLNAYVDGDLLGRNVVRLNYQSIFRLKMLLVLRKNGFSLQRLSEMLGIKSKKAQVIHENETSLITDVAENQDILLFKNIIGQMIASGIIKVDGGIPVLQIENYIQEILAKEREVLALQSSETEEKLKEFEGKVDKLIDMQSEMTEKLIYEVDSNEKWGEHQELIASLREDVEARDRMLTETLKRSLEKNKEEAYRSLPFFVRMFVKKNKKTDL